MFHHEWIVGSNKLFFAIIVLVVIVYTQSGGLFAGIEPQSLYALLNICGMLYKWSTRLSVEDW